MERLPPERPELDFFAVERLPPERLELDFFAVERLPPERLELARLAVLFRPDELARGLVFLPVVTTRWSFSACFDAVFCALPTLLRESLSAFSRSLSTSLPPRPSSLRSSLSASSAVSIDFVNLVQPFWVALEPPERARDAPVLLVAITVSSLGLRATRS